MSTSDEDKGGVVKPVSGEDEADNRERCLGVNDVIDWGGRRHMPHWWKHFTKWCDGKIEG